ncbi:hypothetical protein Taro_019862 [Colocasia esculenta]|uniref:Protein kinase domain-containing protein n=1 Tax=Colocasia esculenta TaxID=4460 RepID=A0A843UUW9_COLES|nr:hypothetical protein [Colocasia esculenta]
MGNCFVARIKAESPFHSSPASASNSKPVCKDANDLSSSGSRASGLPPTPRGDGEILQCPSLKSFTFSELRTATRNFRPDSVLGEGGFGCVFKGWIDEHALTAAKPGTGMVIAVKKLNQEGLQGHKEWLVSARWIIVLSIIACLKCSNLPFSQDVCGYISSYVVYGERDYGRLKEGLVHAEVNFLGRLYHPNLVRLIGYCLEDEHRLLVYEFMPRGSLENHLFRRGSYFQPLSWNLRMKVALGAAKGLAFLHSAEIKVIYRDFKTSNILLDSNYNAKLSDFGLAKDGPTGNKSHVSTRVMGTYGYAAPEYLATGDLLVPKGLTHFCISEGHLTAKSDVYSFGVVLLEMLSGRRAVDKNRPSGEHNLVEWARPYITNKRKIFRVLDTRLEGQYALVGAQKATALALQCLSTESRFRPSMNEVVSALEDLQDAKDAVRTSHAEQNGSSHTSSSSSGHRSRRSSHEVADGKAAYPRPSASPLYTAQAFQEKEDGRGS